MSDASQIRTLSAAELEQASGGTKVFAALHFFEVQAQIANDRLKAMTAAAESDNYYGKLISQLIK